MYSYDYYRTQCGGAGYLLRINGDVIAIEGFSPFDDGVTCERCEFAGACEFNLANPTTMYLTCGWDRVEETLEEILEGEKEKEEEN